MITTLSAFIVLALYAFISAYPTAQAIYQRLNWKNEEEQSGSIPQIILQWLQSPTHEQRFPIFIRSIKMVLLLAQGALITNWLIQTPLKRWLESTFFTANQPLPQWAFFLLFVFIILLYLFILLIFGELLPEKFALLNPEAYLVFGFPLISVLYSLFSGIFTGIEKIIIQLFSKNQQEQIRTRSKTALAFEIREIVNDPNSANDLPPMEREFLESVINFTDMVVAQVTIPRTDVIAIESQTPIHQALALCLETGVTKLPVYKEHLDEIEGIVHLRDLVAKLQENPDCSDPAATIVRETLFVPEAVPLHTLLHQFRSQHMHMAIVLDEFGGTAGVVTLEDLLEEVFGDIMDPFETITPAIQAQKDGSFLVDARLTIDDFNEYFSLNLEVPAYQTMAGYVLAQLNRIPISGDYFVDNKNKLSVTVKTMDRLRVEKVLVQFYLSPVADKSSEEPGASKNK
jgi:CBS domain containing-hemolysin-like protein